MPSGAVGIWYADEYDATTKAIANRSLSAPLSANIMRAGRRQFNETYWFNKSNVTVTEASKDPGDGTSDGSVLVGTAGWTIRPAASQSLPAGDYTMVATLWTDSGTATVGWTKNFGGGIVRENSTTVTTTRTRSVYNFTLAAPTALNVIGLCDITGATAATFNICDFELYSGTFNSSTVPRQGADGNMYLGQSAYDTRPVITAGKSVGFQSVGHGSIQMPASIDLSAGATVLYVSRKVGAGGGGYSPMIAAMNNGAGNWNRFSVGSAFGSTNPAFNFNATALNENGYSDGIQPLNGGWATFAWRTDLSNFSMFLNSVKLMNKTQAVTAPSTIRDFYCGALQAPATFYSGEELFALAVYNRALTDAEVRTAISALNQRAASKSVTLEHNRFVIGFGDSLAFGVGGTPATIQYCPNAATGKKARAHTYGVGGATIPGLDAQYAKFDAGLPADTSGLTIIDVVNVLTNDLVIAASDPNTDAILVSLASKFDARRSLGRKLVMHTVLSRDDASAGGIDSNRARANPELRLWTSSGSVAPGQHVDGISDWASDATLGTDTAPTVATTLFNGDKIHVTTAGYALDESTYLRAVLDGL